MFEIASAIFLSSIPYDWTTELVLYYSLIQVYFAALLDILFKNVRLFFFAPGKVITQVIAMR